jgi:hypothetical protein
MVRMDNVCFQYKQGFIPESYFENVKIGVRQFAPVWRSFGFNIPPDLDLVLSSALAEDAV